VNADLQSSPHGVIAAALNWLEAALLGSIATTIAIIAVACFGLLMLSGRIEMRRGAQLIFGCFILFGASSIAAGIMRGANDGDTAPSVSPAPPPPPIYVPTAPLTKPVKAVPYDPYAGAALPTRS
jgi:type IV secretory pathway VirB2 component (pilin)